MKKFNPESYTSIVFFTGAGMSAESGVPTYRGQGGIWKDYDWKTYACQSAFDSDPEKVLKFHELRRQSVLDCDPHPGHYVISKMAQTHPAVNIVTQNIDGMHQRAGCISVIELHGSLWKTRCPEHGINIDMGRTYESYTCKKCGSWLRPDVTWFEDMLNQEVIQRATDVISDCQLFISIGTSGVVWPAAGFPRLAKQNGAVCVEVNPEPAENSEMYDYTLRMGASEALSTLFENHTKLS